MTRREKASKYHIGDPVAIQRTQFGAGLKLRLKFLGPYKVTKVYQRDRNDGSQTPRPRGGTARESNSIINFPTRKLCIIQIFQNAYPK
ncbi:hypothetical protein CEXT_470861 [Caerostris extrusa]|uniref:Uncharacterized protein n=1 Tax=Caerostris extrusa TaxID=172846 RepID=A0AAV4R0Z9_CAEEX|nr:hypothetical protein CEXT_470861 [Caerostris extrusa]